MKSSHVLTKYVTCGAAGRTTLLDVDTQDITRILSLSWIPKDEYTATEEVYGITLEEYPYVDVYRVEYESPTTGANYNKNAFVFAEIPSHGILFKGRVSLVSSPSSHFIGAAFFTYQTG